MRRIVILATLASALTALVVGATFISMDDTAGTIESLAPDTLGEGMLPETDLAIPLHDTPKPLPQFAFMDGEGRDMTLEPFDGQMVLLNVWATWCVPCREEMPALDRLQARLGSSDFQVLPLSIDRGGLTPVREFYEELDLRALSIYVDPTGRATQDLAVFGIPSTLLIGPSGRELGRLVGPAVWDSEAMVSFLSRLLVMTTGGECNCPMGKHGTTTSGP